MRFAVVLLAACGGGVEATPDAHRTPDVNGLDVVVSSSSVYVFPRWAALKYDMPEVGACGSFESDADATFASDLTNVTLDGLVVQHYPENTPEPYTAGGVTAATTLHATDAGYTIDVPIHGPPFVAANNVRTSLSGSEPSYDVTVSWEASGADSFFVGVPGGFGLSGCREGSDARAHTFTGIASPSYQPPVYVQALAAPESTDTELGPVRVFYGDVRYGM